MFKKSEEQEWSRFRGALAKEKERDDAAPAEQPEAPPAAPPQPVPGPSFRPAAPNDVNVTVPSRTVSSGYNRGSATSDTGEVETLIGERTTLEGTLKCEGALRVLGTVQGEIESKGAVIIEERAQVTAGVTGSQVMVGGRVDGHIHCQGRVEIRPSGRVTGEIQAGALIVHEGAYFEGSSKMAGATPAADAVNR